MTTFQNAISPVDSRYVGADPEIYAESAPFLSGEADVRYQVAVECAILKAYSELGIIEKPAPGLLESLAATVTLAEVAAEEEKTQHNVRALVNVMRRRLPESIWPYIHLGPTSADVTDTARSLQYRDFTAKALLPRLAALTKQLSKLAREHAALPQVGRTHGQHAVPTTFGHAVALYVSRLGGRMLAIERAALALTGKISGAVGAYNSLSLIYPPDPRAIERLVMSELGLKTSPTGISSQICEPEPVTDLCHAAVSCFSVLANLADDLRHLMRTEIAEIGKNTTKDHVGSSTMPHKVNPKDFENVKSLWKAFAPRMLTLYMDQISEHQRDLTNSASGRFVTELLASLDYAIARMQRVLSKTRINAASMEKNLLSSKETYVAEPLYIVSGLNDIPNAYESIKRLAEKAREKGKTVSELIRTGGWPEEFSKRMNLTQLAELARILEAPEKYTGLAREVCLETCDFWDREIAALLNRVSAVAGIPGRQ